MHAALTTRTSTCDSDTTAKLVQKLRLTKCQLYAIVAAPIVRAYLLRDVYNTDNISVERMLHRVDMCVTYFILIVICSSISVSVAIVRVAAAVTAAAAAVISISTSATSTTVTMYTAFGTYQPW
jgi:hypothetical protein